MSGSVAPVQTFRSHSDTSVDRRRPRSCDSRVKYGSVLCESMLQRRNCDRTPGLREITIFWFGWLGSNLRYASASSGNSKKTTFDISLFCKVTAGKSLESVTLGAEGENHTSSSRCALQTESLKTVVVRVRPGIDTYVSEPFIRPARFGLFDKVISTQLKEWVL